jgi:uncharacterized protein
MTFILGDDVRRGVVSYIKGLGYKYVALDLTGYRTGSLNVGVSNSPKQEG